MPSIYANYNTTFTIKNINADLDGPAIALTLLSSELTSNITIAVESEVDLNTIADYVVVYDKATGEIIKISDNFTDASTTGSVTLAVPNNKTYTVSYFANDYFVTSKDVSVQDYDVKGITLKADKASRN